MGDTRSIRNLGYLAWKNDLSWMEALKGARWDDAVKKENYNFKNSLHTLHPAIKSFTKELGDLVPQAESSIFKGWTVKAEEFSPVSVWKYKTGFTIRAWDFDMNDARTHFAATVPVKGGYERFSLEVYEIKNGHPVLVYVVKHVGPDVAFLNGTNVLAYLGSDADMRYNTLCILDVNKDHTFILYGIPKNEIAVGFNLELRRVEDGSVCVVKSDFVNEKLGLLTSNHSVSWVAEGSSFIALAHDTWIRNGKTSLGLPKDEYLESISLKGEWAVTRSHGIRTLWKLGRSAEAMVYIWGEVNYDVRDPTELHICDVRYEPYKLSTKKWTLEKTRPHPYICSYYNNKAPTFVIQTTNQPKGLLVTGYGAYGSPTKVGRLVQRWRPLLNRGWAIASVEVPGSGDHDMEWKFAGQHLNRKVAVETFCESVKDLHEEFGITGSNTAYYGRSAGGLLVTAAAAEDPSLVGALYIESPYVDALRTITNMEIPLTVLETKEFGIGTNPADVISLAEWSPMERIPEAGVPGLFVVARTDMADLEVYPYEVMKYIVRLRGSTRSKKEGMKKLLYVSQNKGHFTTDVKSRAEDLALLDNWINNLSNKYKMANVMMKNRNKNKTNKNRNKNKSNKNRNKNKTNKNRNKNRR